MERIRELVDAYAHCADRRDADGQKSLFTEDTHFVVYMEGEGSEPTQVLDGREQQVAGRSVEHAGHEDDAAVYAHRQIVRCGADGAVHRRRGEVTIGVGGTHPGTRFTYSRPPWGCYAVGRGPILEPGGQSMSEPQRRQAQRSSA